MRPTEAGPRAQRARGRVAGVATVVKKARPTAKTRRPLRPFRGHVDVEPPTAIGETARRRGGEDEEADGEDASPLTAVAGACRCRAPERYRRDDGDAVVMMTKMVPPGLRNQ